MGLPLYVPFAYITFLFGLLWLFSRYYRGRALRRTPPTPWFPEPHTARDVYISLLSMDPPPGQPVLVAALLARAITDVKRIWAVKEAKQALTNLLQKGQVGDELWERVLTAEKELEAELSEVVAEANEYADGWGQFIFNTAAEAAQATKAREVYGDIAKEREQKVASFKAAIYNPGELSILNSKVAVPAAPPKPALPPSAAKQAMLDAIKAAQAKQQLQEQQRQKTPNKPKTIANSTPKNATRSVPGSVGSSVGGRITNEGGGQNEDGGSGSEAGGGSAAISKSATNSASKKKKPKRKKKA